MIKSKIFLQIITWEIDFQYSKDFVINKLKYKFYFGGKLKFVLLFYPNCILEYKSEINSVI